MDTAAANHFIPAPIAARGRFAGRHVAIVTETWLPEVNGVSLTLWRLLERFNERHALTVIRPAQGKPDRGEQLPDTRTILVPGMPLPGYPGLRLGLPARRRLIAEWRATPPDIVHVITEGPLGWSAVQAARQLGIPVISDLHTHFDLYLGHYGLPMFRSVARAWLRAIHNRASLTLVPTQALAKALQRDGFHDLDILPRGVDSDLYHPRRRNATLRSSWGVGADDPVLLCVGRVAAEKNLPLAIASWQRLRQRLPDARLVIVGDGPERRRLQANHPDVIFTGMLRGGELADAYASADLFLFPSLTDTFGNVVLEAMASGLAVVAFDLAAAHEHISHRTNGWRVPTTQPDAFVAATVALGMDPSARQQLGVAARKAVEPVDWQRIRIRYERFINDQLHAGGVHAQ